MITEILVPREDVNDDTVTLVKWLVPVGSAVKAGQDLCEAETTKTIFTITAPAEGWFWPLVELGSEAAVESCIAAINSENAPLPANWLAKRLASEPANLTGIPVSASAAASPAQAIVSSGGGAQSSNAVVSDSVETSAPTTAAPQQSLTKKAQEFWQANAAQLRGFQKKGIASLSDLQEYLQKFKAVSEAVPRGESTARQGLAAYWRTPVSVKRVAILGAGVAAMQIADILLHDASVLPVACLDDNAAMHGQQLFGIPVVGAMNEAEQLYRQGAIDAAIVGVGTNLPVRQALYEKLKAWGIPLVNAIDPSARLNRQVTLGQGIVICSFVHIGVCASIGDNCFLAAHSNVDHHCSLGETVLMGPGCLLSGGVSIGAHTLMGSGVIIQPCLTVGHDCRVASSSVITGNVAPYHAVKNRVHQEIVPIRQK